MASLAHARLAPLTHRYLTMSFWRPFDRREHFVMPQGLDIATRKPLAAQVSQMEAMTREAAQAAGKHRDYTKQHLTKHRALTLMRHRGYQELSGGTITSFSQNQRHSQHEKSGGGNSQGSEAGSARYGSLALLGVLGMFRRPSDDELEEERTRLADDEKIKKMKPIELAIARGVLFMCDQNFGKANELFHEALHMAQDDNDEERENLILNLIASNYFEGGDFQNAEKLFIDLIKRMIAQEMAPTAPPILELSLKLASIYSKAPETQEKALKGFKFVISSLLSDLDEIVSNMEELDAQELSVEKRDELALLGWGYDWFAKHLLVMNDYSGAAQMLQKAHDISTRVLGPHHDQTLILLNDIGTTLAMNNSPHEGKTFIKRAVEGAITNQSRELASFYVNLGLVDLKLRNLEEARQSCEASLELAKKNREHYNSQEIMELSRTCLIQVRRILQETEKQ